MIPRSFGTHDGSFHADEVTACALLLLYNLIDQGKIVRTRDSKQLSHCEYVCDVGGIYDPGIKRFDHHQSEYLGDLSSAGMILLYLKNQGIIDEATYLYFNQNLILGVDAHDNGRATQEFGQCSFSHVVSNFVPSTYEAHGDVFTKAFFEALDFVLGHLQRLAERFIYIQQCKEKVVKSMEKGENYLIFDRPLPWMDSFFDLGGENHPALFVIMPAGNHWKLRGIPPTIEEKMKVRRPLPAAWAGLHDEALKTASGIAGAIFCHKGRFISVWKTKQDVLKALQYALEES